MGMYLSYPCHTPARRGISREKGQDLGVDFAIVHFDERGAEGFYVMKENFGKIFKCSVRDLRKIPFISHSRSDIPPISCRYFPYHREYG